MQALDAFLTVAMYIIVPFVLLASFVLKNRRHEKRSPQVVADKGAEGNPWTLAPKVLRGTLGHSQLNEIRVEYKIKR